ncbi:MAG: hypothetical protein QOJ29_935 [Thermoleophilaceae bacterium]|nr:hypothetical protein [Thermoleophilaceae bacterium]
MKVAIFVYNNFTSDARVAKQAASLTAAGFDVTVYAVKDNKTVEREIRGGYRIVRIWRDPIHYRLFRGGRQLRRTARLTLRRAWRMRRIARRVVRRLILRPLVRLARLAGVRRPALMVPTAAPTPQLARRLPRWLKGVLAPIALVWAGVSRAAPVIRRAPKQGLLFFHKPLMFVNWYRQAHELASASAPQACHANDLITLPVGAWLARSAGVPLVYDAHELYPEVSTLSRRERRAWSAVERVLIGRASRVVTVCESIADELVRRYGVAKPLVVLNCPERANAIASNGGARGLLRESALVDPSQPVILYQGGFTPSRGLAPLVRAMKHVERGTLVMMGWGRLEAELRELVIEHDLADRVRFVPPVPRDQLAGFTADADVGVIPYEAHGLNNYYSTPNKLFEYMAAGIPIACSRFPELVRFVEGLEIGATFEAIEPQAIAAVLNKLLADPVGLEAMSKRALAASRELVWENEAAKLLAAYRELVPGSGPAQRTARVSGATR